MADENSRWDLLTLKLEHLHRDVSSMQGAIKDLAGAVSKLALVEERQTNATAAIERAFKGIEDLGERVAELERAAPDSKRVNGWIFGAIGAVITGAASWLAHKAGG